MGCEAAGRKVLSSGRAYPLIHPPAYYSFIGRAEGIAAGLGEETITPEHVLMALLWDPMSHSSQLMWHAGVSRDRVIDRLREAGARAIATRLPPQRQIDWGERVWIEREQVHAVLAHLGWRIPPGTPWGFNYEGDRAFIDAESHVELRSLVDEALAG